MKEEDLARQAARIRLLCKCLAVTRPDESDRWMRAARNLAAEPRDDANDATTPDDPRTDPEPHPRRVA